MKVPLLLSLCIVTVLCYYDEMQHASEPCKEGAMIPHCFVTPCQLEEKCPNYPDAVCSNYYCHDNPCTTVWRYKGKEVDCGDYGYEDWSY